MIETYDGLGGCIANFGSSDLQIKCSYELGHHGDCSWKKYQKQFRIFSSCSRYSPEEIAEREFINSVIYHQK